MEPQDQRLCSKEPREEEGIQKGEGVRGGIQEDRKDGESISKIGEEKKEKI